MKREQSLEKERDYWFIYFKYSSGRMNEIQFYINFYEDSF